VISVCVTEIGRISVVMYDSDQFDDGKKISITDIPAHSYLFCGRYQWNSAKWKDTHHFFTLC